jgi:hypothetical protein
LLKLKDWLNALMSDCTITVVSSAGLIDEVQRKQFARAQGLASQGKLVPPMKSHLATIPVFDPSRTIDIRPISLLHAIGRITTPPIPNLADLSSTWAIIRYLWAFEVSNERRNQPLVLSTIAREIDFHQKALLSDEVGMGMANYLMTNYFQTPNAIDISIALQTPGWNLFQQYPTSPDYLFFDDPAGHVYVVECKGNQTSHDTTVNQLRRGTEQVPSVVFSDGRRAESLVVATCMLDEETYVYVIDPIDENSDQSEFDAFQKAEKTGPAEWRIKDDEWFAMDSRLVSRAKILVYAGADLEALGQLPPKIQEHWMRYVRRPLQKEKVRTDFGDFVGARETIGTIDGLNIELYRGMLEELYERFAIRLNDRSERERRGKESIHAPESYANKFKELAYFNKSEESSTQIRAQSVCRDGTLLQFTITR